MIEIRDERVPAAPVAFCVVALDNGKPATEALQIMPSYRPMNLARYLNSLGHRLWGIRAINPVYKTKPTLAQFYGGKIMGRHLGIPAQAAREFPDKSEYLLWLRELRLCHSEAKQWFALAMKSFIGSTKPLGPCNGV